MKIETLDERIKRYEVERANLQSSHDATVKQYEQIMANNRTRYAQINGAIMELTALKTILDGEKTNPNGESEELVTNRVL